MCRFYYIVKKLAWENAIRTLSKSQYVKGRRCLKRIWLYNYHKELMEKSSPFQQAILTQGIQVGELARCLFPTGVLIDETYQNLSGAVSHTQAVMQDPPDAIFEGAFIFEHVLVRVDILKRNENGTYDLIEVKSATSVKHEHFPDCAIQTYVLKNLGFSINNVCVMYLNSDYVRYGALELEQLFKMEVANQKIEHELQQVPFYLEKIAAALATDAEPYWPIGAVCNNPYVCEFKKYCWQQVATDSIHFLTRVSDQQRQALTQLGISAIRDVPDDFRLTELQHIQAACEKAQQKFVDEKALKAHLSQLQYPLYFLDFETIGYAVPEYDGTRPYQHLPFQYSLHVRHNPQAELEHYEFLFDHRDNPSRALAESLIDHLGETGSIIVYYASFEGSRLKEMMNAFSDLAAQLQAGYDRLWDLQIPFAKKWYCDPAFHGSASIKNVLPVLVPELSYQNLEIQKGDVAQAQYLAFLHLSPDDPQRAKIKKALFDYCGLDTLAMMRILDKLWAILS